jgi:hypothetical protein
VNQVAESAQLGLKLRDQGIASVTQNNREWVRKMRNSARAIARSKGHVTTDDLRPLTSLHGEPLHDNAWGGIFREKGWKCVGRKTSSRKEAHGREIKCWALA